MRRMATKGTSPTYAEICTNCGAVIPVRDVINIDAEHNRRPKCGEVISSARRQSIDLPIWSHSSHPSVALRFMQAGVRIPACESI